jgi:DNA segregation ATPase FtsK/SpoIIIE-like protein
MNLKQFCYQSSYGVMRGLAQELNIVPGRHYRPSGNNAARVNTLKLAGVNPHYLAKITGMQNELTMFAGLDDKHKVRIGWQGSNILIEIPKPPPLWKQVTIEAMTRCRLIKRGPIATIGLGLQDEPKRINFDVAVDPHIMISGQTGSGKTVSQKLIAWNLIKNMSQDEAKILIFDVATSGFEWDDFNNVASLAHPVVTDTATADKILTWASLEIGQRGMSKRTTPKIFFIVDELKALIEDSKVAGKLLDKIAGEGRKFGMHLILATQYPQINLMKGLSALKRNTNTRLCGRVDNAESSSNALGIPRAGAEHLQGYGDFLLKNIDGLSRLTVAHIQKSHIEALPRVENVPRINFPHMDAVNSGPPVTRQPEPLEPEQVAVALFEPMSINKLQKRLGVGGSRATRVKRFADGIRQWAKDSGSKSQTYNFLSNDWTEV